MLLEDTGGAICRDSRKQFVVSGGEGVAQSSYCEALPILAHEK